MDTYKTYTVEEAKARMQKYCAYQERCHKEVHQKLRDMRMIPEAIALIVNDLIQENYLNETRFAQAFARGKFTVDMSGYYNMYQDFLANETVIAPFYGDVQLSQVAPDGQTPLAVAAIANGDFQAFQTYTNSDAEVNSYGGSIGVSTKILGNFDLGGNYTYAKLDFDTEANPDFRTNFNTPEHKVKATFGNTELFENFGFNVAWRWSDTYFWEASFGDGQIPAFNVLDAQINYRVPKFLKSTFKVGATNILGDEYYTAFGTGFIGSQYYVSWTINNL